MKEPRRMLVKQHELNKSFSKNAKRILDGWKWDVEQKKEAKFGYKWFGEKMQINKH